MEIMGHLKLMLLHRSARTLPFTSTYILFQCQPGHTSGCSKEKQHKQYLEKQDAAHEPECSHAKRSCETNYLNSLEDFSPVTVPVHCRRCRMWKAVECKVWSVKKVRCWVGNVVCSVWSGDCGVWSVKCKGWGGWKVWSVKCKVQSVKCGVSSGKCKVQRIKSEASSVECKVKCKVWRLECGV